MPDHPTATFIQTAFLPFPSEILWHRSRCLEDEWTFFITSLCELLSLLTCKQPHTQARAHTNTHTGSPLFSLDLFTHSILESHLSVRCSQHLQMSFFSAVAASANIIHFGETATLWDKAQQTVAETEHSFFPIGLPSSFLPSLSLRLCLPPPFYLSEGSYLLHIITAPILCLVDEKAWTRICSSLLSA